MDGPIVEERSPGEMGTDHPARPTLVVTMGPPASGKSSLAEALARRLDLEHLSSDVVRKELAGLRPTERRPDAFGRGLYDPSMTRRTYASLLRRAQRRLRQGRSVVLDATFGRADERAAVRRLAARANARLVVLLCRADEATLRRRLAARMNDPRAASDARPELWPALRAAFTEPTEMPEAIALDATAPPDQLVERAIAALREPTERVYPPPGAMEGAMSGAPIVRDGAADALPEGLPDAVAGVLRGGAGPVGAETPALVQTHISWVVLAGPYAYKFKKPLELGFLDYSTPDRRLAACRREVELNRRLCPDVYLGVVPIVERDGRIEIGPALEPAGTGPARGRLLEHAVWMRRLPASLMLDVLVERGLATGPMVEEVAERLARFHAGAATGPGVDEHGVPEAVLRNAEENFDQTRPFVGRSIDRGAFELIREATLSFVGRNTGLLERRVARGRIRDGHGDLHAANVCMTEPVAIFDCIEFNDRYRRGDVAGEVAFLAMDLDYRDRADLAAAFVDRYVDASGDEELRRLLDFYRCYRAYVRGKVESLKLDEPGFGAGELAAASTRAGRYFDLAQRYAARLAASADTRTVERVTAAPCAGAATVRCFQGGRELPCSSSTR